MSFSMVMSISNIIGSVCLVLAVFFSVCFISAKGEKDYTEGWKFIGLLLIAASICFK